MMPEEKKYQASILKKRQAAFNQVKQWVDQILEPQKWGFRESYRSVSANELFGVVYDSQWCRVRFCETSAAFQWGENGLTVDYGRSHAPNHGEILVWNREECWAWWSKWFITLQFLEGISPRMAVINRPKPNFIQPYWEKVLQSRNGNAEAIIRMERAIWEHYGTRLFEIFDLRQQDLWERFRKYVEEYYQIEGWRELHSIGTYPFPPPWRIC